jgi:hypothetical protein
MRRLAWAAFAVTTAMAVVTAVYAFIDHGTRLPASEGGSVSGPGELMFSLMVVAFAALGTLLATRLPRNAIGWILSVASLSLAVTGWARAWYVHAEYGAPGSQPAPDALLWFANWIFVWGFFPLVTALLLLFPDGRLPSRRWWPVAALIALALGCLTIGFAFEPGNLDSYSRAQNALGLGGTPGDVIDALQAVGYPLFLFAAIGSVAALVTRFRRSHGVERQQLKWMAAAAALAVVAWFVNGVLDQAFGINSSFFLPIVLLSIPVAATVAILRYRLYDLGRIVNRTLVYAALSATLAAIYLGLVLLLSLTVGESNLAIAISTLAVAALFRPARARIQAAVDQRFYRRRYDAQRTLEAFGGRLRDELDLDALQRELVGVVGQTVQPAHVTLWLPRNDSRTHGP